MRKKNGNLLSYIAILGMIIGCAVLLYPTGSDLWNRYVNQKLATEYSSVVDGIDESELNRMWNEAVEYNKQHKVNVVKDVFSEASNYELSHPYDLLLNPNKDNIMGYIEIPKINVRLSIGHGVQESTLLEMAGHLEGTSLPIGGDSTHSVVSAHRALPTAKLFTDLDQLEVGDKFYYHILNRVIAYEVDRIDTVLPEDMKHIDIISGKDYSTLLTCTPYGINTHRLLVRGKRIPYEPTKMNDKAKEITFADQIMGLDIKVKILVGAIVFILLFFMIKKIGLVVKSKKQ